VGTTDKLFLISQRKKLIILRYVVLWAELCHSATWQGRTGTARQMAEYVGQNLAELQKIRTPWERLRMNYTVFYSYDSVN
jgi:hypothetical protein